MMALARLALVTLVCVALWLTPARTQSIPTWTANSTLSAFLSAEITRIPGSNGGQFVPLPWSDINAIRLGVSQAMVGDILAAQATLATVGYEVYSFTDTGDSRQYYLIREPPAASPFRAMGTIVLDRGWLRDGAVLAPHTKFDQDSGTVARELFHSGRYRVLAIEGAHRCNATGASASGCSNPTGSTLCGANTFETSDANHSIVNSVFAAALAIRDLELAVTYEIHSNSSQAVDVLIGSGSYDEAPPLGSPAVKARQALTGISAFTYGLCAWTDGISTDPESGVYCAGGNTTQRAINGITTPLACTTEPAAITGRYVQLELQFVVHNNSTNRGILTTALNTITPARQ